MIQPAWTCPFSAFSMNQDGLGRLSSDRAVKKIIRPSESSRSMARIHTVSWQFGCQYWYRCRELAGLWIGAAVFSFPSRTVGRCGGTTLCARGVDVATLNVDFLGSGPHQL